jgi:general secretion pathway protein I
MSCEKWKSRPLSNHWKNSQGFTLLEVIIALGIVAVGILAVSRAITGFADTTISLEQRMLASWVASNRLETLRILKASPKIGTTHGSEEMAERVWYFRETTTATADPYLFRIDITVYADKEETEEVGQLYGYLLNERELNLPIITSEFSVAPSFRTQRRSGIQGFLINDVLDSGIRRNDRRLTHET